MAKPKKTTPPGDKKIPHMASSLPPHVTTAFHTSTMEAWKKYMEKGGIINPYAKVQPVGPALVEGPPLVTLFKVGKNTIAFHFTNGQTVTLHHVATKASPKEKGEQHVNWVFAALVDMLSTYAVVQHNAAKGNTPGKKSHG